MKVTEIEFKPVELEEIPKRGKYRDIVKREVTGFLKLMEKGVYAIESNSFKDKKEVMGYYDSFDYYIKKEKLPMKVMVRTKKNGTYALYLVDSKKLS